MDAFSCSRTAGARCRSSLRLVDVNQSRGIVMKIRNPAGHVAKGENGFCIELVKATSGQAVQSTNVPLDTTVRIGHVRPPGL